MVFRGLLAVAIALAQPESDVSDELAHLEGYARDEAAFVDAARRFDLQQQTLIEWDQKLIEEYTVEKEFRLTAAKRADIRRRADLVGEAWEMVIGYYPRNARARNYYGEYFYDLAASEEKGVQQWLLALKLDPKFSQVRNNLGVHYFHTGRARLGLENLNAAIKLDPKNPDYQYNLAQMYLIYYPDIERILDLSREKMYREAMRLSKNATKYAPEDYDILQDYAVNFFAAENFDVVPDWMQAARAWELARAHAPDEVSTFYTWLNEARVWIRAENWEKAGERLEQALEIRPESDIANKLYKQVRGELAVD